MHGAELVGPERAPELHRARDGEVEPVDEHHYDESPANRCRDGLRHVMFERGVLPLVLLRQSHEEEDHDGHE